MRITFFKNEFAKTCTVRDMTIWQLRDLIATTSASSKSRLPWLKLAEFGDKRTDEGCLRHDNNILWISGIEVDYDREKTTVAEAIKILKRMGLHSLIYTSPSHSNAKPRFRILCPTSRRLPKEQRGHLVARINGLFNGCFARESFTASQAYFFGSVRNNPDHCAVVIAGDYIDKLHGLDAIAIGRWRQRSTRPRRQRPRPTPNDPIDKDLLIEGLEHIPSDGYWPWLEIGAALHFEFGDDGFAHFHRWSAKSSKYNKNQCTMKWNECGRFSEYTGRTILHYADEAAPGWRDLYEKKQWEMFCRAMINRKRP